MELIIMGVMAISFVGMVAAGLNDPLSRRFWEDMSDERY